MKGVSLDDAALVMTDVDDVATALTALNAGRSFDYAGRSVTLDEAIPFGHKFAIEPIEAGEGVRKYGEIIGEATADIDAGEWVHTHNLRSKRGQPRDSTASQATDGETTDVPLGTSRPAGTTEMDESNGER